MTTDDLATENATRYYHARRNRRSERVLAFLGGLLLLTVFAMVTYDTMARF